MQLTTRFTHSLSPRVRDRGQLLYARRNFFVVRGSEYEAEVEVLGGQVYDVFLYVQDKLLYSTCTCPFFEAGSGICKHIWTALLAAQDAGHLAGAANTIGLMADLDLMTQEEEEELLNEASSGLFGRWSPPPARLERWENQLQEIVSGPNGGGPPAWPAEKQVLYILKAADTVTSGKLTMEVVTREPKKDGAWSSPKSLTVNCALLSRLPHPADREILSMVLGTVDTLTTGYSSYSYSYSGASISGARVVISPAITNLLIPQICRTGRGLLRLNGPEDQLQPLTLDEGAPWELRVKATAKPETDEYLVNAVLRRDGVEMALDGPALLLAGGFVVHKDGTVGRLEDFGAFSWVRVIRRSGPLAVPAARVDDLLAKLATAPSLPSLELPEELDYREIPATPQPNLKFSRQESGGASQRKLKAELYFSYDGATIGAANPARGVFLTDPRRLLIRDRQTEGKAARTIEELGMRRAAGQEHYLLTSSSLPKVVRTLTLAGWHVEAEGSLYRSSGEWSMQVSSGVDWFDLEGTIEFGDQSAAMPELLAALKRGEDFVRLDDGTFGLLPEEWLAQYGLVAALGTGTGEALRFRRSQLSLVDALLASRPEVSFDEAFRTARQKMLDFGGISPVTEPADFRGELRHYQREGLGWFSFLEQFGFGGCLADDMGLGKTVQVLALLQSRFDPEAPWHKPTLVVAPRSVIFNWLEEARRFTPQLRMLDHSGSLRAPAHLMNDVDVVLTTYGVLRRDIAELCEIGFDYCILDEAQAIKNRTTATAKAAGLIRADHRLALSGTPIENHLGELWSLFEFLNPGMLGNASAFQSGISDRNPDEQTRTALSRALRPFILRRTKDQVAADLPPKTEQTLYCDLPAAQRKHYDQLRNHYRRDLLGRVERDGIARSKIFVLEALLRLRQAACHPGLIDPKRAGDPSAKLDLLLPQLAEVVAEGHKALVFSQFTKFLALLKQRLHTQGIPYEYLDGQTRDRQSCVKNFQSNPECPLFLISLKAGGLGLNLTAAEYVFLLDPWWNPAVEAQAVDRAHRIGQTLPVFAYRIIARDTVEEKVLELQRSKRELADAIISADNSLIRQIRREDLELLLS